VLPREVENHHVGDPTIFFYPVEEFTQWRDAVRTRSDSRHENLAVASGRRTGRLVVLFQ
jgi:hypothetical protein